MNKFLRLSLFGCLSFICATVFAQTVSLDFTTNGWGLPEGSANKVVDAKTYSNGTYSVTLQGSTGNGFYFNTKGYLMLGKSGATLTLPAFDFAVKKIEIVGNSSASTSTKQNIYVGDVAVSTETKGATGTNTYTINEQYRTAGTQYVLKVTSAHNTQITKINIYDANSKNDAQLAFSSSKIELETGAEFTAPTFTKATTAAVSFSSSNEKVATVNSDGVISLAGDLGTAVITASSEENDEYSAGEATCTISVYTYNVYKKVTTVTSGKEYLIVAQRNDSTMYAYQASESSNYSYLSASIIKEITSTISVKSLYDDAFTINGSETDGYQIFDCYGRQLYQSGKYNSFNFASASVSAAYKWTIDPQTDGTFKISMNDYFIQWGQGTYKTFGVYTEMQDKAVLPMLYQLDESATAISTVKASAAETDTAIYTLSGQRIAKPVKGINIIGGKKVIVK